MQAPRSLWVLLLITLCMLALLACQKHSETLLISIPQSPVHEKAQENAVHNPKRMSLPGEERTKLLPGERLLAGDALRSTSGKTMQIWGSQLCSERGGCWGEKVHPPGLLSSSFLSYEAFEHLHMPLARICMHWGEPSSDKGTAWCEQLPWCVNNAPMTILLDDAGEGLVGTCEEDGKAVRRWPSTWPTPPVLSDDADKSEPSEVIFHGIAYKALNGPILSAGRTLVSRSRHEYRVVSFEWHVDYSGALKPGEWVESDICLTLFPVGKEASLESGEELLCAHERVAAPASSAAGTEPEVPARTSNAMPQGGFPMRAGYRLNAVGVSNIFPPVGEEEYMRRLRAKPDMLALHFRIRLVRDVVAPPLISIRSPLRDRSHVLSIARSVAPYTDFRNQGKRPVRLSAIGTFLSAITIRGPIELSLSVTIDNSLVIQRALPPQAPHRSAASSSQLIAVDRVVRPGQRISMKVSVLVNGSTIFDAACFMLTDAKPGELVVASEFQLWPSRLDMNLDLATDNVDYTDLGEIWAELTRVHCEGCPGAHDTQFRAAAGLTESLGSFRRVATLDGKFEGGPGGGAYITLNRSRPTRHHCVQLTRATKETPTFQMRMCRARDMQWSNPQNFGYYGDFNGDGLMDHVGVSLVRAPKAPYGRTWLSLGKPLGMGPERPWFSFSRQFEHHMLEFCPHARRHVLLTEMMDSYGHNAQVHMMCPSMTASTSITQTRAGPQADGVTGRLQGTGKLHCA
jgi:hypothetical protein